MTSRGGFWGKQSGYRYGRQGNPTVSALEDKITKMEEGYGTICFATGMAAIGAVFQDWIAAQRRPYRFFWFSLFGNTNGVWQTCADQGLELSLVDATDVANVEAALQPNTRMVFVETIANPRTQITDLAKIGELCRQRGIFVRG